MTNSSQSIQSDDDSEDSEQRMEELMSLIKKLFFKEELATQLGFLPLGSVILVLAR